MAKNAALLMPSNLLRAKGWIGQLLELYLGASAGSRAEPDFQAIGVELKTVPLNHQGRVAETTYVCTAPLLNVGHLRWEESVVYKKLARVLWVPITYAEVLAERRIGQPVLWSPTAEQLQTLRMDWEELMDMITLGQLEKITASYGDALHIRPKALDARSLTWGVDQDGHKIKTLPRGFYLRKSFTQEILMLKKG